MSIFRLPTKGWKSHVTPGLKKVYILAKGNSKNARKLADKTAKVFTEKGISFEIKLTEFAGERAKRQIYNFSSLRSSKGALLSQRQPYRTLSFASLAVF